MLGRDERERMFKQVDYVMVCVSDMRRSVEFYRDKLGLSLKFESEHWTEFLTGTTTLALHGGAREQATSRSSGKETPTAGTCNIGFTVTDLEKTFAELKAKGVVFTMPPTSREEEGIKLAVSLDPDGLAISFAEIVHPTK